MQRQEEGYEYLFILDGPRSIREVRRIPTSYFPLPLFDEDHLVEDARRSINSTKRRRVAASEEDILLGLQEVTGRSRSGEECAVCLQDFHANETLSAMPCSHAFHHHCISEWLRRKSVCPLCRCQLLPTTTTPDEERRRRRTRI